MSKLRINELESLETGRSFKVDELAQTFDYEAGIKITSYSQMVRGDNGEFWRVSGSVVLPYVTTGSGVPEGAALVPAGDRELRQELANPDMGAALVARAPICVDNIADLLALPPKQRKEGVQYLVTSFHEGWSAAVDFTGNKGGGEFRWVPNSEKAADGGIVLAVPGVTAGRFVRVLHGGNIYAEWFGAVGNGVSDDTIALKATLNSGHPVALIGTYLWTDTTTFTVTNPVKITGYNASIIFENNANGYAIEFLEDTEISGTAFDFNGKYFNSGDNRIQAALFFTGPHAKIEDCTFKNLTAIEDIYVYAVHVNQKTNLVANKCRFENIVGKTNSVNSGGFCGGVFITNHRTSVNDVSISQYQFSNCTFSEIYTTDNAAGQSNPDSDGIRFYTYPTGITAASEAIIAQSVLSVDNCHFYNVLKSGVKMQDCSNSISNCSFVVDNDRGQVQIYAGFRCQSGHSFSASDITVTGKNIANAIIAFAKTNTINNLNFDTDRTSDSAAVFCGTDGSSGQVLISNVAIVRSATVVTVSGSNYVSVSNVWVGELTKTLCQYIGAVGRVLLDNVNAASGSFGLFAAYNSTSSLGSAEVTKSIISTSLDNLLLLPKTLAIGKFAVSNSEIKGSWRSIYSGGLVNNINISDSVVQTSRSRSISPIIHTTSVGSVKITRTKFQDDRPDFSTGGEYLLRIEGADRVNLSECEYLCTATTYSNVLRILGSSSTSSTARVSSQNLSGGESEEPNIVVSTFRVARVDNCEIAQPSARIYMIGITNAFANSNSGNNLTTSGALEHNTMTYT